MLRNYSKNNLRPLLEMCLLGLQIEIQHQPSLELLVLKDELAPLTIQPKKIQENLMR